MPTTKRFEVVRRLITKPVRAWKKRAKEAHSPPSADCDAAEGRPNPNADTKNRCQVFTNDLTHAKHEPGHCLAPGLFRSLSKGERTRGKLDITYTYGDGRRMEIKGPEPLGADDLRVLQGLIAMAGPTGRILPCEPVSDKGRELRQSLELTEDAVHKDAVSIRSSYRALAREVGYSDDGGKVFKLIRDSIERLWRVSIIAQEGGRRQGFHLLSTYTSDEASGHLGVALNPMIAAAVFGRGRYVRISMSEVRQLKGDSARLVHQRLCGWIDPGKEGRVSIDMMVEYVWPNASSVATQRKRKQRVKASIAELSALGWNIREYAREKYAIKRPNTV